MEIKRPTEKQLASWFHLTRWVLLRDEQLDALKFIENHFTRAEASKEIYRILNLYTDHKLDEDNVFASYRWKEYKEEKTNAK